MAYFEASIKARRYQRRVRGEWLSLGNNERRMLRALLSDASRNWTLSEILEATEWSDQVHVAGAGQALQEAGLIEISESSSRSVGLGREGQNAASNGLLEARIWNWLIQAEKSERNMQGLFSAGFERHEAGPGVGLLKSLGVKV